MNDLSEEDIRRRKEALKREMDEFRISYSKVMSLQSVETRTVSKPQLEDASFLELLNSNLSKIGSEDPERLSTPQPTTNFQKKLEDLNQEFDDLKVKFYTVEQASLSLKAESNSLKIRLSDAEVKLTMAEKRKNEFLARLKAVQAKYDEKFEQKNSLDENLKKVKAENKNLRLDVKALRLLVEDSIKEQQTRK